MAFYGSNGVDTNDLTISGASVRRTWPIRRCLALHWRSAERDANKQGELVRSPRFIASPVEIALKSPKPDAAKAEAYFERALAVARQQQAKVLGTARRDEHGAALARSGQAG